MTSLPATYIAPRLTMKVSQLRRSPLANINFISLCPVTKVYCVIINRILPASSAGQPRAMAVAYIVLRTSWAFLTITPSDSSKGGFSYLVPMFGLLVYSTQGSIITPSNVTSTGACSAMFITTLFQIARKWEEPKCPSADNG